MVPAATKHGNLLQLPQPDSTPNSVERNPASSYRNTALGNPERYIENSPHYHAEHIHTPILILHGDDPIWALLMEHSGLPLHPKAAPALQIYRTNLSENAHPVRQHGAPHDQTHHRRRAR